MTGIAVRGDFRSGLAADFRKRPTAAGERRLPDLPVADVRQVCTDFEA